MLQNKKICKKKEPKWIATRQNLPAIPARTILEGFPQPRQDGLAFLLGGHGGCLGGFALAQFGQFVQLIRSHDH